MPTIVTKQKLSSVIIKCKTALFPKNEDNTDTKIFATRIKKKIPIVLKIFLLKISFKEIKNAQKGFLFLKNRAGMYKNNE